MDNKTIIFYFLENKDSPMETILKNEAIMTTICH
jgi:hypothetical protein